MHSAERCRAHAITIKYTYSGRHPHTLRSFKQIVQARAHIPVCRHVHSREPHAMGTRRWRPRPSHARVLRHRRPVRTYTSPRGGRVGRRGLGYARTWRRGGGARKPEKRATERGSRRRDGGMWRRGGERRRWHVEETEMTSPRCHWRGACSGRGEVLVISELILGTCGGVGAPART